MAVESQQAYANLVLPRTLTAAGVSGRDAALATELTYGTLRGLGTLDLILQRCSDRGLKDLDPGVLTLLRLGSYQLLRTRIPAHAAVASTVDLARSTGNARAAGFCNAVLRKVSAASFDGWCDLLTSESTDVEELAVRYEHPSWIVTAFAQALTRGGNQDRDELVAALLEDDSRPQTHLIGWPGRITQPELVAESGGTAGLLSPYAVRLTEGGQPGALPAVQAGRAGVQDEGSQLCALALTRIELTGGDASWMDLCAGPGGKTALLAALAEQHGGRVSATELHPHRAKLVEAATASWSVDVTVADARELPATAGGYDRVLLDAPCTGLGALRRRPEARWRRTEADLADLVVLQAELLDAAVRLTRPGGVIGYATCSPHLQETSDQITAVLQRWPGLSQLDARPAFAPTGDLGDGPHVQLWPHRHGTDAMFFAALRREE